jgi:peptide/nickel transport system substrate-binding protein
VSSLEEAAARANEAAALVVDDAYVLPIMDSPVYLFVSEHVVNVRDNPNTSLRGVHNNHQWGLAAQ